MCAVLIAENTANAHHMPQSISENLVINPFRNRYRVHVRKQYERQVNQGGVVCFGGSWFGLGWVWVVVGWSRSLAWASGLRSATLTRRFSVQSRLGLGIARKTEENMTSNQSEIVSSGRAFSRDFSRILPHPLPNFTTLLKKN